MRILLGICGEGSGHATRSKVVALHLLERGHELLIAAQGRVAPRLLETIDHPRCSVIPIVGMGLVGLEGAVDLRATIEENAQRLPQIMKANAVAWAKAMIFRPDAIVTDFDSFSWLFAQARDLPVLSVDNAQILLRCAHDPSLLALEPAGFAAFETFMRFKAPDCDHYIVTSVFFPPLRVEYNDLTTLVPPVLRASVLHELAEPRTTLDHALLYKTSYVDDESMVRALSACPSARFIVYGLKSDVRLPANAERREFDETRFLHDLATCRAVVSNGGMSLLGEAVSLGKPVYAVPVEGQYEQLLNAAYVERLGYGVQSRRLDGRVLSDFLERAPTYAAKLAHLPPHDRNARLYATLDALLPPA